MKVTPGNATYATILYTMYIHICHAMYYVMLFYLYYVTRPIIYNAVPLLVTYNATF